MGTVFPHRSPSLFLTPGLAGNQAPSFRAAHYITPARRSQATSTMAAPSPPVHDPITTADRSTPELPQPSHLATRSGRNRQAYRPDVGREIRRPKSRMSNSLVEDRSGER